MRIAVLGAGAWGSALAINFCGRHEVSLWARGETFAALRRERRSPYLGDHPIPEAVRIEGELARALAGSDLALVATSTAGLPDVCRQVAQAGGTAGLLWACKGFDPASKRLPHQVVADELPEVRSIGALSGPSFASEVARGLPAALVVASRDGAFAARTATALNSDRFRLYSTTDLTGVELAGAVKNVIAIAAGICDGLELGLNARAALITRGLAEITRLGVASGGQPETFAGLAGLGDLVLTCTGALSRNREVGLRLARGSTLPAILAELGHVAEGVQSAQAATALARARGVEMPIANAVQAVLCGESGPKQAVQALLARDPRPESL
jgi:glycerol-3-phosphate dehydrogenase (NAD(P)+)